MIATIHIATPGPRDALSVLLRPPSAESVPGLQYAATAVVAPLGARGFPPRLGVGMIAAWENDRAFEEFSARHPVARRLAGGWHVRLEPLRVFGAWPEMPGLPSGVRPHEEDEPVAVLTLGWLRLNRVRPFLRAAGPAEAEAVKHPATLASTALARPPHLVSTFSLWRNAAEMREYAVRDGGPHSAAMRVDRENGFHHESAFVRFRPYASEGDWDGRDPLAAVQAGAAA
jgi:hypothetical protein